MNHFGEQTKSPTPSLFDQDQERIQNIGNTLIDNKEKAVKIIDKPQRKISEIRIFYDDRTWETFVPQKS